MIPIVLRRPMLSAVACASVVLALPAALRPAAAADPVRVTDQRGTTIELPRPAERVVFIPIPAPSTYIAIDGTPDHIVGVNPIAMSAIRDGILGRIFPGAQRIDAGITRGRFVPNVEAILALAPDVVVQWATEGPDVIVPLERAGLPVLGIRYGSQAWTEEYTRMFAALAGKPERAETIITRQHARRAELEQALAGLPASERPSVLYFQRFAGDLAVAGAGNNTDENITLTGGVNAAASLRGSTQSVTYEQVLQWDPQVILLGTFDAAKPEDLYADPRWQAVRAVRDRRVYRLPLGGYRWDPPSQETALSWTWLASLLHPDRVRFDLRRDMAEWFQFLYGHTLTGAETDAILDVSANAGSKGYTVFQPR